MESKRTKDVQRAALTEAIVEAARSGREDDVRKLLSQGALINAIWNEESALTAAARWNHLPVVKLLLEKGALVDQTDDDGWSALTRAARWGNHDVVKHLIEKGAAINQIDAGGGSAMTAASYGGHTSVVALLLQRDANVNQTDRWGRSALTWAAGEGHVDVVKLLLEKGASVDRVDGNGLSALITAAGEGHHKIIDQLLCKGASLDLQDNWGRTALIWAASVGHHTIVRQLLDKGASVEIKNEDGCTAFEEAKATGQDDIVKLLMEFSTDFGKKQLSEEIKDTGNKRKEDLQNSAIPQEIKKENISTKNIVDDHCSVAGEQLQKLQIKATTSQNKEKNIDKNKEQTLKSDKNENFKQSSCVVENISIENQNSNQAQIKELTQPKEKESQDNVAPIQEINQDNSINAVAKDHTTIQHDQGQEKFGVVFNELLCYLVHVRDSVPKEEIAEIISKFYEESYIVEAYEILCNCLPETLQRNIRKIKEINSKEMVASMYEWLDIIKSDKLPEFGCLSLSRLPATLIKDVNSATLYMNQLGIKREIGDTKQELREFKMHFSSEVQELKTQFVSEIASIKDMLIRQEEGSSSMPDTPIRDIYELCPSRKYSEVAMLFTPNDSRESTVTRDSQSSSGVSSSSFHSLSNVSTHSYQAVSNTGSSQSSNTTGTGLCQSLPSADSNKLPWTKTPVPYFSSSPRSPKSTFYEDRTQPLNAAKTYQKNKPAYEELPIPFADESVDGFTVVRSKKNKQKYRKGDRSWIIEEN